ncbi:glycosyltransferase [Ideonella sp. 4Y16]|uniref:glycosyltransferase n=1 Tax=Ideonella alba TaxID=2824118 RepID=UPI001B393C97|nr:glycosyltransferase [Ideonella alba]
MSLEPLLNSDIPRISVITITYKDREGLRRTHASVLSQDERLDWIVVDGDPDSIDVPLLREEQRVYSAIAEKDEGIYDAMAKGLLRSRTEFVIFMNSGDTFLDDGSLSDAVRELGDSDVCYFAAEFRSGQSYRRVRAPRSPRLSIWHSVPGNQQATVYRRSALLNIGIPRDFRICGDYAVACLLHKAGAKERTVNRVISVFELGGASTTKILDLCREAWTVQAKILRQSAPLRAASFFLRICTASATYLSFILSSRK